MKKMILMAFIALMTLSTATAQMQSFKFKQNKRKYIVYLPKAYDAKKTYPLLYNFHGGGMTATEQMFYSGMNKSADKFNFIVVYPAGIHADWNVGFEMSYLNGTDDVGFIKALNDTLRRRHHINPKAVFATGLSRGGFFCHRLATEMPETFAAIASIGGPLPDSVKYYKRSDQKIAVMQVSGTADQVVNYNGKAGAYSSALSTFDYWVSHNHLSSKLKKEKLVDRDKKDGTSVIIAEVADQDVEVMLVSIQDGGHTWPGSDPFNIGFPLGKTTTELDINEFMWDFFNRNKKP
jgi:polyhydroxybutyrate depolymerase